MFSGSKSRTEVKIGRSKSFLWAAIADNVQNVSKFPKPDEKRKQLLFRTDLFQIHFFEICFTFRNGSERIRADPYRPKHVRTGHKRSVRAKKQQTTSKQLVF